MHTVHSSFRKFSLRGLLIAGTVASLGLPLGQKAYGIGGSAIQAAYTPRESVGAAPSVSLVGGGSSSSAAAYASSGGGGGGGESSSSGGGGGSRRTTRVSSEDEGSGTTRKRRPRKSSEEGESRTARTSKSSRTSSGGGTETYEAKDQKDRKQVALEAPPSKPLITLSTGFESRYIYHGVDIVGFNSGPPSKTVTIGGASFPLTPIFRAANSLGISSLQEPQADKTSPVYYFNGDIAYKGFHLGVGYIQAVNMTQPSRETFANEAATLNRLFAVINFPTPFTPFSGYQNKRKYYKEIDINLDYTLGIIANVLDATVGYNSYIFPDHDFKGTNYQGELYGRLAYKQLKYIQPSVTYFRYFSDARGERIGFDSNNFAFKAVNTGKYLEGNYIEARIDGAIPLFTSSAFSVGFAPYVLISANDGYLTKQVSNTTRLEFNTFETGFKIPMTVKERFSVTPYFNFGYDISDYHESNDFRGHISPFKEDIWGGVTFSYRF